MNRRLTELIKRGGVRPMHGAKVDCWNMQTRYDGIAVTITARIAGCNHYKVVVRSAKNETDGDSI